MCKHITPSEMPAKRQYQNGGKAGATNRREVELGANPESAFIIFTVCASVFPYEL